MLKLIIVLFVLVSLKPVLAQDILGSSVKLKLKENLSKEGFSNESLFNKNHAESKIKKKLYSRNPVFYQNINPGMGVVIVVLFFINPILVFEDKKVFGGLTKEISFSTFPYGRVSFEYSFLFRQFNKHHLRFSYNYDFLSQPGKEWVAFAISPGAGYFTDTKNKGIFAQLAFGVFVPTPLVMFDIYLKYRYTNTLDKNKSDIHDISFGSGIIF